VQLKREYNDERSRNASLGAYTTGSAWYSAQAYRALNQALGRCLRHKQDYGSILLVDDRFLEDTARSQLPPWLTQHIRESRNVGSELTQFFARLEEAQEAQAQAKAEAEREAEEERAKEEARRALLAAAASSQMADSSGRSSGEPLLVLSSGGEEEAKESESESASAKESESRLVKEEAASDSDEAMHDVPTDELAAKVKEELAVLQCASCSAPLGEYVEGSNTGHDEAIALSSTVLRGDWSVDLRFSPTSHAPTFTCPACDKVVGTIAWDEQKFVFTNAV